MQVTKIDSTIFASNKITTYKSLWNISHDPKFTDVKPIKAYAMYLKAYGLDLKTRKSK